MTKIIFNWVFGFVTLGTASIGGAGIYRILNPQSIGGILLKEGNEIIGGHEDELWDKLVKKYEEEPIKDSKPKKIKDFSLSNTKERLSDDENKVKRNALKDKCWDLLTKNYRLSNKEEDKENAKEWCTKSSSVLKNE